MEGEADLNQDNEITALELHTFVEKKVAKQSVGSQIPELQGDVGKVIVAFD